MLNEIKAHCYASELMARDVTPKEMKGNKENSIKKATRSEKTLWYTQPLAPLSSTQRSEAKAPVELKTAKKQRTDSKPCQVQQSFDQGHNPSPAQHSWRHKPHVWNLPAIWQEIRMNAMISD